MNDIVNRIKELQVQKAAVDGELADLKAQAKAVKDALNANRKPRQKKEAA